MQSCDLLLREGLIEQPGYDGQVSTFVIRRKEHRILVFALLGRHCVWCVLEGAKSVEGEDTSNVDF
jgi:hypothetical protein